MCVVLLNSYEVTDEDDSIHDEAIEVVLGTVGVDDDKDKKSTHNDLIFSHAEDGAYVVDRSTMDKITAEHDHTEEMTDHSLEHDGIITEVPPRSPTVSSGSDEDREEMSPSSQHGPGRLGRTIATIRARATGYLQAQPLSPDEGEDDERRNSGESYLQVPSDISGDSHTID